MDGNTSIEETDEEESSSNQRRVLLVYGNQTGWERLIVNYLINYLKGESTVKVTTQDLNCFQISQFGDVAICIIVISVLPFGKPLCSSSFLKVIHSLLQIF